VENQLFLSLIGLSPLIVTHLRILPHSRVRPSFSLSWKFRLFTTRSLSFGSYISNFRLFLTRFRFVYTFQFKLALYINLLTHYTQGTLLLFYLASTAIKHRVFWSFHSSYRFFFHTFPHGTSSLSVFNAYLPLDGGPPLFKENFTCFLLLIFLNNLHLTGLLPSLDFFHSDLIYLVFWGLLFSLTTTYRISFDFFSSCY